MKVNKLCNKCGQNKMLDQFRVRMKAEKPTYGHCRQCEANYERSRSAGRKEYQKAYRASYIDDSVRKPRPKNPRIPKQYDPEYAALKRARETFTIRTHFVTCKECSVQFIGHANRVFCNIKCAGRYAHRIVRKKQRARLRTAKVDNVDPILVFSTHQWHCAQCNIHTPRHLKGKHKDNSPELDHIIPLSKCGQHSYINTQLLCRKCNSIKSNNITLVLSATG